MDIKVADTAYPHRLGQAVVTALDAAGQPLAETELVVAQTSHDFLFGNIAFDLTRLANGQGEDPMSATEETAALWLDLYNFATLPFYWRSFEPVEGQAATTRLQTAARWLAERGVKAKGHPLAWHTEAPRWLLGRPLGQVEQALRRRIRREAAAFAGLADIWDVVNEAVIMPVFTAEDNAITPLCRALGRLPLIRLAFEEARAANPDAVLLLNDFDLTTAYECLIEGVLEMGLQVDALGLQTHMHQGYWGEEATLAVLDRFARYGLPLHLTENSLLSGDLMPPEISDLNDWQPARWPSTPEGEARQADEMVRHYRCLVGCPAVASVTYWGLSDKDAWLGAPVGLLRADGSRKPAYDALRRLIKQDWWVSPSRLRTDAAGRFRLTGFAGGYELSRPDGKAKTAFHLAAGPGSVAVSLA